MNHVLFPTPPVKDQEAMGTGDCLELMSVVQGRVPSRVGDGQRWQQEDHLEISSLSSANIVLTVTTCPFNAEISRCCLFHWLQGPQA